MTAKNENKCIWVCCLLMYLLLLVPLMPSVGQCLNVSFRISVVCVWKTIYIEREMVHGAKAGKFMLERISKSWVDGLSWCYI